MNNTAKSVCVLFVFSVLYARALLPSPVFAEKIFSFIVHEDKRLIGNVRFTGDHMWENFDISIMVNPEYIGKGYSLEVLQLGINRLKEIVSGPFVITARVKFGNTSSLKLFEKAGFKKSYEVYELV